MRLLAAALALCGCNQVFGLDATRERDAAPPPDTRNSQVRLSLLVAPTTLTASEAPPVLAPLPGDPHPRVALLGEPFAETTYTMDATSGVVDYPFGFVGNPWRLEYTPPGGVPHEVQWSPADGAGHLVVPVAGRVAAGAAVPPNSGYTLSMKLANDVLYSFSPETVIYTTGYWSATPSPSTTLTPTVDFASAAPMAGARGTPSPAAKDIVIAIDYQPSGGCRVAKISGNAVAADVVAGAMTPVELLRDMGSEVAEVGFVEEDFTFSQSRLGQALGARGVDASGSQVTYARLAHTKLPAFTASIADVPAPTLIPLATCPPPPPAETTRMVPLTNHAGGGLAFEKAFFAYASNDRTVSGVRLRSSLAGVGLLVTGQSTYRINLLVPLATAVALGPFDLADGPDGQQVGQAALDLAFDVQTGANLVADYFEVTLYRLGAATLEPVRVYVGADPGNRKLRFDPSVLTGTDTYVFAIRTYRGQPNARNGDFRTVDGPQAVGTIFTRTFRR